MLAGSKRSLVILMVAALAGYFVYAEYNRKEEPEKRLSANFERYVSRLTGPLSGGGGELGFTSMEIVKLREEILDKNQRSSRSERAVLAPALALCDALLRALGEREEAERRLSARLQNVSRKMNGWMDLETHNFFIQAQKTRWLHRGEKLRTELQAYYTRLRALERRTLAGA